MKPPRDCEPYGHARGRGSLGSGPDVSGLSLGHILYDIWMSFRHPAIDIPEESSSVNCDRVSDQSYPFSLSELWRGHRCSQPPLGGLIK
jgi:hypothetical protein